MATQDVSLSPQTLHSLGLGSSLQLHRWQALPSPLTVRPLGSVGATSSPHPDWGPLVPLPLSYTTFTFHQRPSPSPPPEGNSGINDYMKEKNQEPGGEAASWAVTRPGGRAASRFTASGANRASSKSKPVFPILLYQNVSVIRKSSNTQCARRAPAHQQPSKG